MLDSRFAKPASALGAAIAAGTRRGHEEIT